MKIKLLALAAVTALGVAAIKTPAVAHHAFSAEFDANPEQPSAERAECHDRAKQRNEMPSDESQRWHGIRLPRALCRLSVVHVVEDAGERGPTRHV